MPFPESSRRPAAQDAREFPLTDAKVSPFVFLSLKFRTKFWGIKTLKKERKVAY